MHLAAELERSPIPTSINRGRGRTSKGKGEGRGEKGEGGESKGVELLSLFNFWLPAWLTTPIHRRLAVATFSKSKKTKM